LSKFQDTLTEDPGETNLVEFGLETGDTQPIA